MRGVSIIIPVYNSADILQDLLHRLEAVVKVLGTPCELVLVNDGSQDQSWEVVVEASHKLDWVRGINLMRNYGQHNALLCGIREARHDVIVTMDDDLQHPPEEIPKLLRRLEEGADVVYGPPLEEQHGLWRDLASLISKIALRSAMGIVAAFQSKTMTYDVPFNRASIEGKELEYVRQAIEGGHISGDGPFTKACEALLQEEPGAPRVLLTTSCTHALELSALLLNLRPGDEIIVPSFAFVSTANAFAVIGARPVFVGIRPDTLNLDEGRLPQAASEKTRAVIPLHYAGVGCEMDAVMS